MQGNNTSERFILRDGRLVSVGGEGNPATATDAVNSAQPLRRPVQANDFLDDSHEELDSTVAQAVYKTLTAYRDYFSQGCREALAKDIAAKVKSLEELSNAESISAVVQRSIDWSGHAVPQHEIPTITGVVTTAIQNALRQ